MRRVCVTIQDFDEALNLLNHKLQKKELCIEIRAIGGYAMLKWGIRKNGFTEDIDSVVKYKDEVVSLIEEVSDELHLQKDWLNSDSMNLIEVSSSIKKLTWVEVDGYSNIKMYVADARSLILLKAKAIQYGGIVPRKTDKNDLVKLLSYNKIKGFDELLVSPEYESIKEFDRCLDILKELESWKQITNSGKNK